MGDGRGGRGGDGGWVVVGGGGDEVALGDYLVIVVLD